MLYEIMRHIKNFFPYQRFEGCFTIKDGRISLPSSFSGSYILIEGSAFNDDVYNISELMETWELKDETFTGALVALRPPRDFLILVEEMKAWQTKHGNRGPYSSESFGGYSYTRAVNRDGNAAGLFEQFASRLNTWRKV